jgi:D-glycero-D-manno-heptose 1,7-bisphosphate phosphatase
MKLVILDRDGVINYESKAFVKTPDEWIALPGAILAIARLYQAGWKIVIASNQSGLGRQHFDMATLHAIHVKMQREVTQAGGAIDAIFICPHHPKDACTCRKPLPGLFEEIAKRYNVTLTEIPAVGDSLRDLQACAAVGCTPWLVKTGNGLSTLAQGQLPPGTQIADDLAAVALALLETATP